MCGTTGLLDGFPRHKFPGRDSGNEPERLQGCRDRTIAGTGTSLHGHVVHEARAPAPSNGALTRERTLANTVADLTGRMLAVRTRPAGRCNNQTRT